MISKKFDILSRKAFTDIAIQFHIELRVNGRYLSFHDLEGCNHLRYMKKSKLVAISILLNGNIWSTVLCIDHDEDPIDAMENTKSHVLWKKQ